ncbi:hypothetical protein [Allostreptomyces psammosilenae]|uniref:Uncharacterized protein n=1 Tax=Allostreptomyces psammosilenae TaxID=1892865 RepID=A0A852ZTV1_9ACTN|nr:hypothetical protein [Allostreptomyces psammosilenae]NYI04710.1 hypothetical protein [Allostreptomyces psammosilenae]
MNAHHDTPQPLGSGYPARELARAFQTALTHDDVETRERAEGRVQRWRTVLAGMADGRLRIGSSAPVAGLPAWVTPEVVRGGFATGAAAAGGPMLPHEVEAARRAGVPADRRALFAHHLTEPGMRELIGVLTSGAYEIHVPEEAALLTVAWLVQDGDASSATRLVDVLEPFADRLRFTPRPAPEPLPALTAAAYRHTVGQVSQVMAGRRRNPAVEAMNEALTVWNPFADRLLAHWMHTVEDGRVLQRRPDADWLRQAALLLEEYRHLAAEHTLCGRHRRPKENLAILRTALEDVVAGRTLSARQRGLLQHAVDAMVRRRGAPGSTRLLALRARQAGDAARPSHHALAQLLVRRLADLPQQVGTPLAEQFVGPVTEAEQRRTGLPAGTPIPDHLAQIVRQALAAPVGELIERGVVPSAEVLAEIVPQLVAPTMAAAYPDPRLRRLMGATYGAFRNRRSLLLVDLQRQTRFEDLPWVRAVASRRRSGDGAGQSATATLRHPGELALDAFPATVLPNPLVRELNTLARAGGVPVPLVEELAADIFTGTFTNRFVEATRVAADLLHGSLYAAYYGIDYPAVLAALAGASTRGHRAGKAFARLCRDRAGTAGGAVAANGMVIEQAQILTTHNLAALAGPIGATPQSGWAELARRAFTTVCRLTARLEGNPRPLGTIKNAAYAWRQVIFHLSLADAAERAATVSWLEREASRHPGHVRARLAPVLAGLDRVHAGGSLDPDGGEDLGQARRFLGWSATGHWM